MPDSPLRGARIALTGTRKAQETADFVRRLGGIPTVAPALDTTPLSNANEVDPVVALAELLKEDVALVIFLTGVGARALLRLAESVGRADELRSTLATTKVVARGPKALGALKGAGVRVDWMPRQATVEAILEGLDQFDLAGHAVAIQWSGFVDDRMREELRRLASPVIEMARLHPYEYTHFNRIAGGVEGARDRYMLDYWALSFKQASLGLRAKITELGLEKPAGRFSNHDILY